MDKFNGDSNCIYNKIITFIFQYYSLKRVIF